MPSLTPEERIGTILDGHFELLRVIQSGGMGVVMEARDTTLDRRVAVKLIRAEHASKGGLASRFLKEAKLAASLGTPNAVTIHAYGQTDDGAPYIVMEFLEGETLTAHIAEHAPMSVASVARLLEPVMDALEIAHAREMVHRDLKPDNIFLARVGAKVVPKILDFGIALFAEGHRETSSTEILGTPAYMAPEQARATSKVDQRADVWSMGVVAFEALTGSLPFEFSAEMSAVAVLATILTTSPRPLRDLRVDVEPSVAAVIDRALATTPEQRFQTMAEFRDALVAAGTTNDAESAPTLEARAEPRASRSRPKGGFETVPARTRDSFGKGDSSLGSAAHAGSSPGAVPTRNRSAAAIAGAVVLLGALGLGAYASRKETTPEALLDAADAGAVTLADAPGLAPEPLVNGSDAGGAASGATPRSTADVGFRGDRARAATPTTQVAAARETVVVPPPTTLAPTSAVSHEAPTSPVATPVTSPTPSNVVPTPPAPPPAPSPSLPSCRQFLAVPPSDGSVCRSSASRCQVWRGGGLEPIGTCP